LSRILRTKKQIFWQRAAVAILTIALWPALAWAAARLLVVHAPLSHADVIVVMSGSATFRERAQHAARLYHEGRALRIVLTNDYLKSSWSSIEQRNPYYYECARDELLRAGVPAQNISVIMVPIMGTYDEAMLLKQYSEANQLSSLLVVTSAYHSRRALWTFRRIFQGSGKSIGIDPAEAGIETPPPATWWLHRLGWDMVPNEYLKIAIYRYRY
jgi:uncharacterized SAM-binding protein YcdF (DUF218 family)